MPNKVKYNLKNVHYAVLTEGEGGAVTYDTPVAIPGAVSLSLDAEGDTNKFYADGIAYFTTVSNQGYLGDFECAGLPESFRKDVLCEVEKSGVSFEDASAKTKAFAFLFQFDGDVNAIKHVLYNCKCTRPTIASQTNEESIEVRTETLSITATPLANGIVKARCDSADAAAFNTWFTTVVAPNVGE